MAQTQAHQPQQTGKQNPPATGKADNKAMPGTDTATPALPPAASRPGSGPNRVDVTGVAPEGIRIDPDITEGHPGYQQSGDSEIIPPADLPARRPPGERAEPADA